MSSPSDYSDLITSEHRPRPKFTAMVELFASGFSDEINVMDSFWSFYDFDAATGTQLDDLGTWIGLARDVNVPTLGMVTLGDSDYKLLLRSKIAANHFDGSMEQYQDILQGLFVGEPFSMFAVDNQDMSITIYILNASPSALQLALLKGGFLPPKPEGVRINFLLYTGPLFGLDHDDTLISGPDIGSFATYL